MKFCKNNPVRRNIIRLIVGGFMFLLGFTMEKLGFLRPIWSAVITAVSFLVLGYDVISKAARNIVKGRIFDEKFLMSISTIGAFAIGEYAEAAAVMLFYQIGELFEDIATDRSRESIVRLIDIRPDTATVRRNGEWTAVSPDEVSVGETILVSPGEKVPLDGVVVSGASTLDTRALTGESVPKNIKEDDEILSGCVNLSSPVTVRVTKAFGQSTAAKLIELTEHAAEVKSKGESAISRFAKIYTPVVVTLAVAVAVIPSLISGEWGIWLRRGLVTLVISCPCALVVSVPLTYFSGLGAASRSGLLIKGSTYLESLANIGTVALDKTGTLTKGVFNVTAVYAGPVSESELLHHAASAEQFSSHPTARSIIRAYSDAGGIVTPPDAFVETAGRGVSATVGKDRVLVGSAAFICENGIAPTYAGNDFSGKTTVHVAANGRYEGCIVISDEIKSNAAETVRTLQKEGISVEMLTGDRKSSAKAVADTLGIAEYRSELLPGKKVARIEELIASKEKNRAVVFVGDGINDAPVLARADIGVSMGGIASDAAIEAADAVLMTDDLSALCRGIRISKKVRRIVRENIGFAITVKAVLILLGWLGAASMWSAVFGDVGVLVIVLLNSMRMMKRSDQLRS